MLNIYCDIGETKQFLFQDPSSFYMIGIDSFHDLINYFLLAIFFFVFVILIFIIFFSKGIIFIKYFSHSFYLEFIWTILPAFILITLAIPSFKLLYALDEPLESEFSVKVKGNQWFWSYEISDFDKLLINFDSYTLSDDLLQDGQFRLLDVDNPLILPTLTPIRFLITSNDVIHSFAIPSLGIKLDAINGRINAFNTYILRDGLFYGQCSELCGTSHYNMSIVIHAVPYSEFIQFLIDNS